MEPKFSNIGKPCVFTTLDNGHSVSTVVRVRDFDPNVLPKSKVLSNGVHMFDEDGLGPGDTLTDLYAVLWNDPKKDGVIQIMEIGGVQIHRNP